MKSTAMLLTGTVSGSMPTMEFLVLMPDASAVPAAAESVMGDEAE